MGSHLVLAGGGHAHLFVLEGLARGRFPAGLEVSLVAPDRRHAYSVMVQGMVGGRYRADEVMIDLATLARAAGAAFREGKVRALEPGGRIVTLADGHRMAYDLISLAIGSGNAGADLPGVAASALFLKPIDRTLAIVPAVERAARGAAHPGPPVVVVGGGAAGVELALNLRTRLRLLGHGEAAVSLVDGHDHILRDRSAACRRAAEAALSGRRVRLVLGAEVSRLEGRTLLLADGRTLDAELVIWATGPSAPGLFYDSGLATDVEGYLRVDSTLRSTSHPEVFAAGDAVSLEGHPDLAKAGVYAVRQGPVLRDNLADAARGRTPRRRYQPQRHFLALLNTGDGRAVFSYGAFAATGRWAMALKDRVDRRFLSRFRR